MSENKSENKQVTIQLIGSLIGWPEAQVKIAKALGLSKRNQCVVHYDSPTIRGMINKIPHLVSEVK